MKRTFGIAAVAGLMLGAELSALAGDIAVLRNGRGRHYDEFKSAFDTLGITPVYYNDTKESLEQFLKSVDAYDLVFVSPLVNFDEKKSADMSAVRRYVENGGMIVLTDASYTEVRSLFAEAIPGVADFKAGKCTSDMWSVLGHVSVVEPAHPVCSFPNALTAPDWWADFETVPDGWSPIMRCSEGKTAVAFRKIGRGCAIVSALRLPGVKCVENIIAYARLHRSGLKAKDFTMSELRPGRGHAELTLEEAPSGRTLLTFKVENGQHQATVASAEITNATAALDFKIPYRGPIVAEIAAENANGRYVLYRRAATMPQLLTVKPNAYRGILSTKRRCDEVKFPVCLEPVDENLHGADLTYTVWDPAGNRIVTVKTEIPMTNDVPREQWVSIPLDRELAPGEYRIRADLFNKRAHWNSKRDWRSEATFEILAPRRAQVVVDEDGTFLFNGVPFFPLGIYHTDPAQFEDVAKLGFNFQQLWKWAVGSDAYGSPAGLDRSQACGLKCLFESNHDGEGIFRECAEAYRDHPAMFGWYVADEPAEGSEAMMTWRNRVWHECDKNHPTFIASCRPDLFREHAKYADILGFDDYVTYDKHVAICQRIEREVVPHKATICVPWAHWDADKFDFVRRFAYTAIVHGVRGLVWYCWKQVGGGPIGIGLHAHPDAQKFYAGLLKELKSLMPGLLAPKRRTFEEGPIHGIVLNGGDHNRFLIMVNTEDREVSADFKVPELLCEKVSLPCEPQVEKLDEKGAAVKDKDGKPVLVPQTLAVEKKCVKRTFAPYEIVVWRW